MDDNQKAIQQLQIQQALQDQRMATIEARQDKTEAKVEEGFLAVDARFDKMDEKLTLILTKNPVVDFFKENWKAVAFIGFVITYQPSIEMVKVVAHILFPGLNIG